MGHFEGDKSLSQASARGKIKWYNGTKGYGFVTLDNGGDAFCHASVLASAGHQELQPGVSIICDLTDSQRGMQVVAIHSVDLSTADAPSRGPKRDFNGAGGRYGDGDRFQSSGGFSGYNNGGGHQSNAASGDMTEGKVKFFNDQKGFGFVMPDSGNGDIYLHASALRRSGIQVVEPDQRIRFSTRQGNKGVEVDKVELI
jgi:CspA family cold shock protein